MKQEVCQNQNEPEIGNLGLPPNQVWLCEYSSQWPVIFAEEKDRIMHAVGPTVLNIQHVGSTSINGLKAKPIIDILLGVERLDIGLQLVPPLKMLAYRYLQTQVVAGHHVFAKGTTITHLLHVVKYLGPEWTRIISFRDALRASPALAMRYEAEKSRLSLAFATNRRDYSFAKEPLIDDILAEIANQQSGAQLTAYEN